MAYYIHLDGVDDQIEIPHDNRHNLSSWSVEILYTPYNSSPWHPIFNKDDDALILQYHGDGRLVLGAVRPDFSDWETVEAPLPVTFGRTYHVVGTFSSG